MPQQLLPDTRIPLSGLGGGGQQSSPGPLGTLGAMMRIKEEQQGFEQRQREAEAQRRAMEDDDEMRWALQTYERPDEAVDHLWKSGRAGVATKLAKSVYEERKARLDEYDAKVKSHGTRLEQAAQILQGVTDDAGYQTARPAVLSLVEPIYGQTINDALPTTYDEKRIKALVAAGTTRAQQLQGEHQDVMELQQAQQLGLARFANPDDPKAPGMLSAQGLAHQEAYRNLLVRKLSTAQNQQQWDWYLQTAKENGAPMAVLQDIGPWSDDAAGRARSLGMTIPQEAAAKTAETRAATAQTQAGTAAAREARLGRGGGGGGLTRSESWRVQDSQKSENDATEEWASKQYEKDFPYQKWPEQKDEKGQRKRVDPGFGVERLSPENQTKFARRKLDTANKARTRQGQPSVEDEGKAAAAAGDLAAYGTARDLYNQLTQWTERTKGIQRFEDLVPPPTGGRAPAASQGPTSRPNSTRTPEQARDLARAVEIASMLRTGRDPKTNKALDAAAVGKLTAELRALVPQR